MPRRLLGAWLLSAAMGSVGLFEGILFSAQGRPLPAVLAITVLGLIAWASAIARDVTEAQLAFEAARSMIDSSLDSMVAISPEGRITDVNEATVKVTGISREELIGTAFSDYFTEPEKAHAIYQQVFPKGWPWTTR